MKFKTGMLVNKKGSGVIGKVVSTLKSGLVEVEWEKATRYKNHLLVDRDAPQTLWENEKNLVDVSPN